MKNKRIYLNLFLIILFGFLIRLMSIDKAEGLWNDEYISWYISVKPMFSEFFQAMFQNCHMPFYYFYLKFWTALFGNSDYVLRISSLIPSLLSIVVMFFVGKELKDEKTGIFCAAFASMSGFLIYFSQEVRFYSILFLFSALVILFFLKLLEKQNYINFICFFLFNLLVMFTHTIGFVFVFFNFLVLFSFLKKQNKISGKQITLLVLCAVAAMIPFVPFLYKTLTASYISQFWSDFSFTKLFFVFADYVSPIQINLINTPINVSTLLMRGGKFNWGYFIFAIIPLIIAFLGVLIAIIKRNLKILFLGLIFIATLLVMIIASSMGRIVLITKYTTELYPIFIAIAAYGLYMIRPETIRKILVLCFFGIIFLYLSISEFAPQRLKRPEGHKLVADLVRDAKLDKNDRILLLYYDKERFGKYLPINDLVIDSVTKYNFQYKLLQDPPNHMEVIKVGKVLFFDSFKNGYDAYFSQFLKEHFFTNMNKGDKFALISLNSVAFIDESRMKAVTSDKALYKRMPFLFLVFSHISNNAKSEADRDLTRVFNKKSGKWEIFVWEKK